MSSLQSSVLCFCASNTTKCNSTLSPQSSMSSLRKKMFSFFSKCLVFATPPLVGVSKTEDGIARQRRGVNHGALGPQRETVINLAAASLPATLTYVFSAKGATLIVSLGCRPRRHGKKAPALNARFTPETGFFGLNTASPGLKPRRLSGLAVYAAIESCPESFRGRLEHVRRLWR